MIKLRLDVRQVQSLVGRLSQGVRRSHANRKALADKIGDALKELAEDRIKNTKTAPDGTPWRAWSVSYAATRSGDHSLLMDTRELVDSFEPSSSAQGNSVRLINTAPYAGYVQAERPFLGIGVLEQNAIEDLAQDWLERLL